MIEFGFKIKHQSWEGQQEIKRRLSQVGNLGEIKGRSKKVYFQLLCEDLKMKSDAGSEVKERGIKWNFHQEKGSLDEKLLGFWVMLFL